MRDIDMLDLFAKAHSGLAMLSLIATIFWAISVYVGQAGTKAYGSFQKISYISAMATTGLTGIIGLIATLMGPFMATFFPWIGLAVIALHGVLGARSRKAYVINDASPALTLAVLQVVCLIVVYYLMVAKPF